MKSGFSQFATTLQAPPAVSDVQVFPFEIQAPFFAVTVRTTAFMPLNSPPSSMVT